MRWCVMCFAKKNWYPAASRNSTSNNWPDRGAAAASDGSNRIKYYQIDIVIRLACVCLKIDLTTRVPTSYILEEAGSYVGRPHNYPDLSILHVCSLL